MKQSWMMAGLVLILAGTNTAMATALVKPAVQPVQTDNKPETASEVKAEPQVKPNLKHQLKPPAPPRALADAAKPEQAEQPPSVLAPGSRVVASKSPDEDFVILGRLDPDLAEPAPVVAEANPEVGKPAAVAPVVADATPVAPPALLKAPVEIKSGVQPVPTPKAVMVAGPNIGATPTVTKKVPAPATLKKAVTVALKPAVLETPSRKPLPKVVAVLQKPKAVRVAAVHPKAVAVLQKSKAVRVAAVHPKAVAVLQKSKAAHIAAVQPRPVVKTATAVNKKTAVLKVIKTAVHRPITLKAKAHLAKTVTPSAVVFASYHPPKHKVVKASAVRTAFKPAFKPVIKPYQPKTQHATHQAHFKPVIKRYIPM